MSVPERCTDTPNDDPARDNRGRGHILCRICGDPVADHDLIGPCPEWDHAAWGNLTLPAGSNRTMYRRLAQERARWQ